MGGQFSFRIMCVLSIELHERASVKSNTKAELMLCGVIGVPTKDSPSRFYLNMASIPVMQPNHAMKIIQNPGNLL